MNNEYNNLEKYIRPEVSVLEVEAEGVLCSSEKAGTANINDFESEQNYEYTLF